MGLISSFFKETSDTGQQEQQTQQTQTEETNLSELGKTLSGPTGIATPEQNQQQGAPNGIVTTEPTGIAEPGQGGIASQGGGGIATASDTGTAAINTGGQGESGLASRLESQNKGFEKIAKENGIEPPDKNDIVSGVRSIAGVLNVGAATAAGAVSGSLDPEVSTARGAIEGFKKRETFGFADVLQDDLGLKEAETIGGPVSAGLGLTADVLLDPITYLSFGAGAGAKLGGKVLKETAQETAEEIAKKSVPKAIKGRLKGRSATKQLAEFMGEKKAKRAVTSKMADKLGTTIDDVQPFDQGGIKLGGQSIVSGDRIKNSLVGKAARKVKQSDAVQGIKDSLGKLFVHDYETDPVVNKLVRQGKQAKKQAKQAIVKRNEELFKNLDDTQSKRFFNKVFEKKLEIVKKGKKKQKAAVDEINSLLPEGQDIKFENMSRKRANKLVQTFENQAERKVRSLQKAQKRLAKRLETKQDINKIEGENEILKSDAVEGVSNVEAVKADKIDNLRNYKATKDLLRDMISDLKKGSTNKKEVVEELPEFSDQEKSNAIASILEQEAFDTKKDILNLQSQLRRLEQIEVEDGISKGASGSSRVAKDKVEDKLTQLQKDIIKSQNNLTDKIRQLDRFKGARTIAKKEQKAEKLQFDDPELQRISNILFEGDNALVDRFRKLAGIPEGQAIKYYIPSKFRDIVENNYSTDRVFSAPDTSFQKKFRGAEEDLIRDPFEAYSRGQIDVMNSRINQRYTKKLIDEVGEPIEEMNEQQAKKLGFKKIDREGPTDQIQGWVPEPVHDEITKFFGEIPDDTTKAIDDLAKKSGFDAITGLFKGYVTSLFPGFHIRNIASQQFMKMNAMGVDALNPRLNKLATDMVMGRNMSKTIKTKTGDELSLKEVKNMVEDRSDILQSTQFGDAELMLEEGMKNLKTDESFYNKASLGKLLGREGLLLKGGRKLGAATEDQAKFSTILASVQRGDDIDEAIKTAEEGLFNYNNLAPFEKRVMRRLIPFYTFARKNAELQVKTLMNNPGRVALQTKTLQNVDHLFGEPTTEEDLKGVPDFVRENLGIKAGTNRFGQDVFMSGFGLPIEEFMGRMRGDKSPVVNAFKTTLAQSNPLLKVPAEKATGVDFFRGRPIAEVNDADGLKSLMDTMPDEVTSEFKDLINYREIDKDIYAGGEKVGNKKSAVADPSAMHILRNLPTARVQGTASMLGDPSQKSNLKMLNFLTGINTYSIDKARTKFFQALERNERLQKWLVNMGMAKEFSNVYREEEN